MDRDRLPHHAPRRDGADQLTSGGPAPDNVGGGEGNDTVAGGAGDDMLDGGRGSTRSTAARR